MRDAQVAKTMPVSKKLVRTANRARLPAPPLVIPPSTRPDQARRMFDRGDRQPPDDQRALVTERGYGVRARPPRQLAAASLPPSRQGSTSVPRPPARGAVLPFGQLAGETAV
jgi:hypothetical protein